MKTKNSYQTFIVDDHQLFVDGLKRILTDEPGFNIVGISNTGEGLPELINDSGANLLLLDIQLGGSSGLAICKDLRRKFPSLKIIMISMIQAPHILKEAEKEGANGYIPKTTDASLLKQVIREICEGKNIFLGDVIEKGEINLLSEREMEIIYLIKQGHTTKIIAEMLFLSEYTVETHRKNILRKLQLGSANELIAYAYANHL